MRTFTPQACCDKILLDCTQTEVEWFFNCTFQLLQFPDITYEADSDDLHTVFIADLDIYQPGSPIKNYIHFMATNVPGR